MSEVKEKNLQELHEEGEDFGNFYPKHHILIAFESREQAAQAREVLALEGGFTDIRSFDDRRMAQATQRGMDSAGLLGAAGASLQMVELQHRLAKEGCHFLLVRAPTDEDTEKVMAIVRRGPFRLAQKYHPLVIETLY